MGILRVAINVDPVLWKQFRKQLKKQKLGTVKAFFLRKVEEVAVGESDGHENTPTVQWIKMQKVGDKWIVVPQPWTV